VRGRELLDRQVSESDWQTTVIDLAQALGWRVAHFRPARTEQGWRTAVQADGAGFPDLTMVRGGRLLFIELKSGRGRLSVHQGAWLDALRATAAEVYVWRPGDFDKVQETLRDDPPLRANFEVLPS
jgi:hypothetical protein